MTDMKGWDARKIKKIKDGMQERKKIKGIINISLYICLVNSLSIILYERKKYTELIYFNSVGFKIKT